MKKIILHILMIFSLFGCSPNVKEVNAAEVITSIPVANTSLITSSSSFEFEDFPEFTDSSSSNSSNITISSSSSEVITTPDEDLEKDDNFNEEEYPADSTNVSLDIIQVAETTSDELLLYVYNPTMELEATSIDLSLNEGKTYALYNLTYLSSYKTIDKYVVNNLEVTEEKNRYYSISCLYRYAHHDLDDENSNYTSYDEVGCPIYKHWYCYYNDSNELIYEMEYDSYVDIEPVITSYIYYKEGFSLRNLSTAYYDEACFAHFIGFNVTNFDVDKIYDADISFVTVPVTYKEILWSETHEFGDEKTHNETLKEIDEVTFNSPGLFDKTYSWNRISTSSDFINDFKAQGGTLNETSESDISNCQFVFSFYESIVSIASVSLIDYVTFDLVTDVVILRLKFRSQGNVYNMGVVSNKTSSSGESSGEAGSNLDDTLDKIEEEANKLFSQIGELITAVFGIVGIVLGVYVLIGLIPLILPVFKALLEILLLPFKFISSLFKKGK